VDLTSLSEQLRFDVDYPLVEHRSDPHNELALFVKDNGVSGDRPRQTNALTVEGPAVKYMIVAYEALGSARSLYPVQKGSLRLAPSIAADQSVVLAVELTQFPLGADTDDTDALFALVVWAAVEIGATAVHLDLADQDLGALVTARGFAKASDERWVRPVVLQPPSAGRDR